MRRGIGVACIAAVLASGCGGSSPSTTRLRTRAAGICLAAQRRLRRITPPSLGPADRRFLQRGISVLVPELTRLRRLPAQGDDRPVYAAALSAMAQEIAELQRATNALAAQPDPAPVFASLEARLRPLESQADRAWSALQIPACVTR